jgi:ribose 5-phosphate isomerase B
MRIACAFDHAGVPLRETVLEALRDAGHEPVDLGADDDYPDSARKAGAALRAGEAQRAIIVCGSGAGVSVAANKLRGIRASLAQETYTAAQCVSHDDCNVLCLGARVVGPALAAEVVRAFAGATFSGEERHVRRLRKIADIEAEESQST